MRKRFSISMAYKTVYICIRTNTKMLKGACQLAKLHTLEWHQLAIETPQLLVKHIYPRLWYGCYFQPAASLVHNVMKIRGTLYLMWIETDTLRCYKMSLFHRYRTKQVSFKETKWSELLNFQRLYSRSLWNFY